jgi:hypothetical protein
MEYTKPELTVVGSAVEAIQGYKGLGSSDSSPHAEEPSEGAYQADE